MNATEQIDWAVMLQQPDDALFDDLWRGITEEERAALDPALADECYRRKQRIVKGWGTSFPAAPIRSAAPQSSEEWPEPKPLPSGLPQVAEFAPALLPDRLRPWLLDVAERMQCPPDFPAVAGMVAAAAVLGRKVGIRPKRRDDWLEVANVWGALIGPPGVMKSPAIGEAFRPLRRLEAQAFALYEEELAVFTRQKDLAKLQRDATRSRVLTRLKKGESATAEDLGDEPEIEEPRPRRYVVNDSSVEALGEVLRFNPNGTLAYRDELAGLLKSLDKEGNEESRAFYLTAWNGKEAYTFDRIGRGLNLRIEACCLCLFGSIQPGRIGPYLREAVANGGDDGLLARFGLLVWPDVAGDWRNVDRFPDTQAKAAAFEVFTRLDAMQEIGETDEDGGIPFLRFDDAAQELFTEWRIEFEKRLRQGAEHPALEAHLSKYRKLVPALALLLHLADTDGPVSEQALLKSLAWSEYLETHARRAYASVMGANVDGARALLNRITRNREDVPSPFSLRDVYLRGWSGLSSPDDARQAADVLADLDVLRRETVATGGRPRTEYHINPRVRP